MSEVPNDGDAVWAERARPLLEFLSKIHTMDEIVAWGATMRLNGHLVREVLAWCENRGVVRSQQYNGVWVWWRKSARPWPRISTVASDDAEETT